MNRKKWLLLPSVGLLLAGVLVGCSPETDPTGTPGTEAPGVGTEAPGSGTETPGVAPGAPEQGGTPAEEPSDSEAGADAGVDVEGEVEGEAGVGAEAAPGSDSILPQQ